MLDLIAWQRGVTRAAGEAERLYRLRVAHAYANARDSGQIAGWKRIFKRLELGDIALEERKAGQDWDVIGIMMDDGSFPNYQNVLELIVADYGRTCRRYHFISRIPQRVAVRFVPFDDHHATICARSDEIFEDAGRKRDRRFLTARKPHWRLTHERHHDRGRGKRSRPGCRPRANRW